MKTYNNNTLTQSLTLNNTVTHNNIHAYTNHNTEQELHLILQQMQSNNTNTIQHYQHNAQITHTTQCNNNTPTHSNKINYSNDTSIITQYDNNATTLITQ